MLASRQFRILNAHCAIFQASTSLAGGFVGAYLLKLGFSLSAALAVFAGVLALRFGMRMAVLPLVQRLGYRGSLILGAAVGATQFLPLLKADSPAWLVAWVLVVSFAESLYWPIYHATTAVTGGGEATRGREIALRQTIGSVVSICGPLLAGWLLTAFGPGANFGLAGLLALLSVFPLLFLGAIPAGPVPTMRQSFSTVDRVGMAAFAADGWISSGLALAWPMILFTTLGSHFESLGATGAISALVGAVAGIVCGRGIDSGKRERYLVVVSLALIVGFILRASSGWSPMAAVIANATGAAVGGLYSPVLMSVIYDRAKRSGAAYRFHVSAEAGWDIGAVAGCLVAAAVAWIAPVPSLAVLPAALGVGAVYLCIKAEGRASGRHTPVAAANDESPMMGLAAA